MADPAPAAPAASATDPANPNPAAASQPAPASAAPAPTNFDPSKVSDEDFAKVFEDPRTFNHPRFKQLNEKAKEADTLRKAQEDAEKKSLEEQGKYKELAEKEQQRANSMAEQLKLRSQDNAIVVAAGKAGITDIDAALKLIDRSGVSVDDNGQVSGAAEAIKALAESKPYLVGSTPAVTVGSPSNPQNPNPNPANTDGQRVYKLSEINDRAFYKANQADILKAMREGRTINDTGAAVGIAGGQGQ